MKLTLKIKRGVLMKNKMKIPWVLDGDDERVLVREIERGRECEQRERLWVMR